MVQGIQCVNQKPKENDMFLAKLFLPGSRTYTLSVAALLVALLLQGDAQGVFNLAPMLKLTLTMVLTIIVPLVPVYIRKAIQSTQKK